MTERGDGGLGTRGAQVVLPCAEFEATLAFFTERLGFRVESIFPADQPTTAVIAAHGLRLRLQRDARGAPGLLRIECAQLPGDGTEWTAPNGTVVQLVAADPPLVLPRLRPEFVHTRNDGEAVWKVGRAGMRYRDLVPSRLGGALVASHIQIPDGGEVPDYVHFHRVRFQFIYCARGWVRVVYEDQGPPFVLESGDCVLQPPGIRHRVLECSPGLEVIEVGSPAEHETHADGELDLPTAVLRPERDFGGQRFVRHEARTAVWGPAYPSGGAARDTGISAATHAAVGVRVVRLDPAERAAAATRPGELVLLYVLAGSPVLLRAEHGPDSLSPGDCAVIPPGTPYALEGTGGSAEWLEVAFGEST